MKRNAKRVVLGLFALCVVGLVVWIGPVVRDLYTHGFFDSSTTRTYHGDDTSNLKAIRTALLLYHDSEGQFPDASGWMDAIENRIEASDMSHQDSEKKLVRPEFQGQKGKYGYSMNDAASGKYKGDLHDPKMVLVFESDDTRRDAHGPASSFKSGIGISLDGTIVGPAKK